MNSEVATPIRYAESEAARMLMSPESTSTQEEYERDKTAWIARQIASCPPMSDRQKSVIRTAFAAHHAVQVNAA